MKRRNFIKTIVGVGAGTLVAGTGYVASTGFYDVVDRIVREELAYLPISDSVYDAFMRDVKQQRAINHLGPQKEWFIRLHSIFGKSGTFLLPYRYKYEQYKSQIVGTFMLSTNFFSNGMDESKPISYATLYHPYKNACSNPFSSLYYS